MTQVVYPPCPFCQTTRHAGSREFCLHDHTNTCNFVLLGNFARCNCAGPALDLKRYALWDRRFMDLAIAMSDWSKDPRRKVGCVVIDDDHNQLSGGFNGFPRGIKDDYRLENRDLKLKMVVHAEANAVAAAARNGHSIKGGTMYVTRALCTQCAALVIQAGIKRVVALSNDDEKQSKWADEFVLAASMLAEAQVQYERQ